MICPNCGYETIGKFCPSCGTKMPAAEPLADIAAPVLNAREPAAETAAPVEAIREPVVPAQEPADPMQELVPPEPAAPGEVNAAARQAETVAAAASAAIAAESACPEPAPRQFVPSHHTPNQSYIPNQPTPSQGYAPNQAMPSQGYAPNRPMPSQGYAPNQPMPNQGYAPNQPMPNQGYIPNQPTPNKGYAPYPNGTYAPAQGGPASRSVPAQGMSPAEIGKTPASQLVRKLATSGVWIIAVMAATLSYLLSLGYFIYNLVGNRGLMTRDYISGAVPSLLFPLLMVILLWAVFCSAASKKKERMGSGALTAMKIVFIISLVLVCITLAFTVIFGVILIVLSSQTGLDEYSDALKELLLQYNVNLTGLEINFTALIGVIFGVLALIQIFAVIFIAKVIKSLNTCRRVLRTGMPDDRVSILVGVFAILGFIFMLIYGVAILLLSGPVSEIMAGMLVRIDKIGMIVLGVTFLLNAVSTLFFAIVLFKYRSGMRQLGARRGVVKGSA